jgi:hypothetical protein
MESLIEIKGMQIEEVFFISLTNKTLTNGNKWSMLADVQHTYASGNGNKSSPNMFERRYQASSPLANAGQ